MKYNLYFHCSENTTFDIFTAVKYSFFEICIIFNQYFSVFHYFVYNKSYIFTILTITLYIKKKGKFNYWNQSSNGNVIHKDDVKFPIFSQNTANFPNSMGPDPIPKKGCESPGVRYTSTIQHVSGSDI